MDAGANGSTAPRYWCVADVAGLLDTMAAAAGELGDELDRVGAARTPLAGTTVIRRVEQPGAVRPAVRVGAQTAAVDPGVLRGAVEIRRTGCASTTGRARRRSAWTGGLR